MKRLGDEDFPHPLTIPMFELLDTNPDLNVQETEYARLLGYPRQHVLEGRPRELAEQAMAWYATHGKPWVHARQIARLELGDRTVRFDETRFTVKPLYDRLLAAEAHSAVLVAVSAGGECEDQAHRLWQEGKPDEYFFMEMYGSAVVEHMTAATGGLICDWAERQQMTVLPHYSPGYSGWDISDQNKLWELMRPGLAGKVADRIQVLETGMLRPKKSLLAVFGITRRLDKVRSLRNLVPCETCSLSGCPYRRAPYQHSLPQFEDVHRLEGFPPEKVKLEVQTGALSRNGKYSTNLHALRKWSQERLELKFRSDGSIAARFRYDGTTCSNLGHPLAFTYEVRLSPPRDGYKVLELSCVPAAGDRGYQSMCEYLNNAESLMSSIADEQPLLGRSLDEVLQWERPYSPSGCYCDAEHRAHKWGLVFEVIHYALVQREQEAAALGS